MSCGRVGAVNTLAMALTLDMESMQRDDLRLRLETVLLVLRKLTMQYVC